MDYVSTSLRREICIDRIITIHYFEYMRNFAFQGESHNFWEFVCVDKGEVEVQADERVYQLKQNDLIFHKPMEFHTIQSKGNSSPNLVVISFESQSPALSFFENKTFRLNHTDKALLSQIIAEARLAFSTPIHIPSVEQVIRCEQAPFGSEQLIGMYLEELLIRLRRESAALSPHSQPQDSAHIPKFDGTMLEKVLQYLQLHVYEQLSLKQICSDNLIGRSCLQSLFHRELHCGVIETFSEMKIDLAKQIIRDGSKNFTEIADFLAYNSLPHFSRQFKKSTGMSPSEYANSIKGLSEKAAALPPMERNLSKTS